MTPAVGDVVLYFGPESDDAGSHEAMVLAVDRDLLDLWLHDGRVLHGVRPLHPLNCAGWRWPEPPAAPALQCQCGGACEVVDYTTGVRSCSSLTPGWP